MGLAIMAVGAVLLAAIQVSVVSLFPISGATADLGVIAILVTLVAAGPRPAMLMTPAVALTLGMAGSHSPGVLFLGYTAVLPLGYLLDRYGMPPGEYPRVLLTAVGAGLWVRLVLTLEAIATGAAFAPVIIVRDILTPGLAFDAVLITLAYVPLRLMGRAEVNFTLHRRSWLP